MAFGFFNIGKANEEIERLNQAVAALTAENTALKENTPLIEAAAEKLKTDSEATALKLSQVEADLATAKDSVASLTAAKEKAEADLAAANAKLANPGEQIKNAASAQAAAITASIGVPPVVATSPTQPSPSKSLTGLERAIAAHKEAQNQK